MTGPHIIAPTRRYLHAAMDSGRWLELPLRADDIVVSTSMKAGTTWMQRIVVSLMWPNDLPTQQLSALSPWVESTTAYPDVASRLEGQKHRHILKSHSPADGIPLRSDMKYIVVGRDGRATFLSMAHHYANRPPSSFDKTNRFAREHGLTEHEPFDGDIHKLFAKWISTGSFAWQNDGAPYWSHFSHYASWWQHRRSDNVLFVHYDELSADLEGEMRRVAAFLDLEVPDDRWTDVVRWCTKAEMSANEDRNAPFPNFFGRDTSVTWRDVLTDAELALYDAAARRAMPDDLRAWLDRGGRDLSVSASGELGTAEVGQGLLLGL